MFFVLLTSDFISAPHRIPLVFVFDCIYMFPYSSPKFFLLISILMAKYKKQMWQHSVPSVSAPFPSIFEHATGTKLDGGNSLFIALTNTGVLMYT